MGANQVGLTNYQRTLEHHLNSLPNTQNDIISMRKKRGNQAYCCTAHRADSRPQTRTAGNRSSNRAEGCSANRGPCDRPCILTLAGGLLDFAFFLNVGSGGTGQPTHHAWNVHDRSIGENHRREVHVDSSSALDSSGAGDLVNHALHIYPRRNNDPILNNHWEIGREVHTVAGFRRFCMDAERSERRTFVPAGTSID